MNKTNLVEIKRISKALLYLELEQDKNFPIIVHHPYANSGVSMNIKTNEMLMLLDNKTHLQIWRNQLEEIINKANNYGELYGLINLPYKLTFLKFTKDYMSKKDFSEYFADAWVLSENPNGDVNVSIEELIDMYKYCDKKYLMAKEDLEVYNNLPDEFIVYRGVSKGRNPKGLSYTRNKEKAEWFANRFGEGYLIEKKIKKENVLAYFNTRQEDEIVVDVNQIF